jgi:fucose 4-O-acetylase-like acetyltransferase
VGTRVGRGARRGALAGVYFFVILFVVDKLQGGESLSYMAVAPFRAAAGVIGGFVIAGAILLVGAPYVMNTWRAVGLAVTCAYPAMLGLVVATAGWRPVSLAAALVAAVIVGVTGGVIMYRGWWRRRS